MAIERLLKDDATEEKGERARVASFIGAMAIADLVKTTLGPKGMDKILQSTGRGRSVTVTNDGATILKSLHIDNPAAKVLVDISKVQDDEVGDGTTSVVVFAGELLREAEKLVMANIHPMTIIAGYRMAVECARNALLQRTMDNKEDSDKFKSDLMNIARTTLSSKILSQDKEHFAKLAVDAVLRLKGSTNLESIQIIKKAGGSLKDSFLDEGFILDKKIGLGQPKRIENAKILVANTAMDTDKVKIYGARVRVDSMTKVAQIEAAEKEKMREKVQKIIGHGINCFVNRQLIYNFPEELFAESGILAIEHADFDGIERLALVLPTFAALFPFRNKQDVGDVAGLRFDPKLLLHGQQYMEIYKPFPSNACVENKVAIAGLHDKGKATILELETISYEKESGEVLCMNRSTIYLRGAGGFSKASPPYSYSNYPTGQVVRVTIPTREPSKVYEDCMQQSQALLYRLSGDYNPLHSDPTVAHVAGFSRPILHGLCTLGFAVRAIVKCICNGDPTTVKSIMGRFLLHVYPGETLITEMWLEGSRVIYQMKVKERNRTVLSGYVVLNRIISSL